MSIFEAEHFKDFTFAPDDTLFAVADLEKSVKIYECSQQLFRLMKVIELEEFQGSGDLRLIISPNNKSIVAVLHKKINNEQLAFDINVFDIESGRLTLTHRIEQEKIKYTLALFEQVEISGFKPYSNTLVIIKTDTLYNLDITTGKWTPILKNRGLADNSIKIFSKSKRYCAFLPHPLYSLGNVSLWDTVKDVTVQLANHLEGMVHGRFSDDEKLFISGGRDGFINVYEIDKVFS
jgi:WD40 repeat protein